jgi:hypothetical protein
MTKLSSRNRLLTGKRLLTAIDYILRQPGEPHDDAPRTGTRGDYTAPQAPQARPLLAADHRDEGQLDQLELHGYLDPDRRGDRADETEAIEAFLMDSLRKGRS